MLLALRDTVTRLRKDLARERQDNIYMHGMYAKLLQVKDKEILEAEMQVKVKDATLQMLAERKTSGTPFGCIAFMFVVWAMCGALCTNGGS